MKVSIPYNPDEWGKDLAHRTSKPFLWVKEHCPSFVGNRLNYEDLLVQKIDYYFFNNEDAIMFKLTWS